MPRIRYTFHATASILLVLCSTVIVLPSALVHAEDRPPAQVPKISPHLQTTSTDEQFKVWVLFTDKGFSTKAELQAALDAYETRMSTRVKRRRSYRTNRPYPDITDLPVPSHYISAALEVGGKLRSKSRWLNAIALEATATEISEIARLPFVRAIDPILEYRSTSRRSSSPSQSTSQQAPSGAAPLNYGNSRTQIEQIQADFLHEEGFLGAGMVIGLLDTGFSLEHAALERVDVIAQYDFVNDDDNPADEIGQDDPGEDEHGSVVLGILAGNAPGNLMGVAYRASYLLAKTEKAFENGQEFERLIEEDWWIEGLEWVEEMGADIISSSLGYSDWYRFKDLDGKTSKLTIAANLAVEKGMPVLIAAGNLGAQPPGDLGLGGRINVPADGFDVLAIGSVDRNGRSIRFSSHGPTFDGRIKPDLVTMGGGVTSVNALTRTHFTSTHRGTSMSTPLATGVVTLLMQAFPLATPQDIANVLRATASQSDQPDNTVGYGIVRARSAYEALLEQFGETGIPQPTSTEPPPNSLPLTLGRLKRGVLLQNYPNPFNAETWIPFKLTLPSRVTLRIYDLRGHLVNTMAVGDLPIGDYSVKPRAAYWNGHNLHDEPVSSGTYLYVLDVSGEKYTRKLTVLE